MNIVKDKETYLKESDVSSKGFSTRVKGWKTSILHYVLSILELDYFYYLDWLPSVIDIREQYLIPLGDPVEISERLRIRPRSPQNTESKKQRALH
jgi:hypothetical protein